MTAPRVDGFPAAEGDGAGAVPAGGASSVVSPAGAGYQRGVVGGDRDGVPRLVDVAAGDAPVPPGEFPRASRRHRFSGDETEYLLSMADVTPDGCWLWPNIKSNGYGRIWVPGPARGIRGRMEPAHRWAYERLVGPVPPGLVLDHLCRNRACCNPIHLEPVTQQANIRRGTAPSACNAVKTHCPQGHEYTPENTYQIRGGRMCRTCSIVKCRRQRAEAKKRGHRSVHRSPRK